MPGKKKRMIEFRVGKKDLDSVCCDCGDFLNHPCVECIDCPVDRLKKRQMKEIDNAS